eukprot:6017174-Amphidinium_carterae.1
MHPGLSIETVDAPLVMRWLEFRGCAPAIRIQGEGNYVQIKDTVVGGTRCADACIHIEPAAKRTRLRFLDSRIAVSEDDGHGIEVQAEQCEIEVSNSNISSSGSAVRLLHFSTSLLVNSSYLDHNGRHGIDIPHGSATVAITNSSCSSNRVSGLHVADATVKVMANGSRFSSNGDSGLLLLPTNASYSAEITFEKVSFVRNAMNGIYVQGVEDPEHPSICNRQALQLHASNFSEHASFGVLITSSCAEWRSEELIMDRNAGGMRIRGAAVSVDITGFNAKSNRGPGLEVLPSGAGILRDKSSKASVSGVTALWNTEGLRFDVDTVTIANVSVMQSLHGIRIENSETKAHLENIVLKDNGDGLALLNGAKVDVVNITVEGNFNGVIADNQSICTLTRLTALQNHIAVVSRNMSSISVRQANIMDNLKGYSHKAPTL